jgi:NDP-sugar pyrophosphorylase family protein
MSTRPWPALVLAAGLGTRLAPLSTYRAKPAVPVAGQPLIGRILRQLRAAGIERVVINLHHHPETITGIVGDGSAWGLAVRYSWESEVLGSGGGPARALPLLAADRFFVVNGDTLAAVDFAELAAVHDRGGARATLAVAPARLDEYNALIADADGGLVGTALRGTALSALPAGTRPWHYVGVQAVDASALAGVAADRPSDILREVYARLRAARADAVRVHPVGGAFFDIGTPADYLETARRLAARLTAPPRPRGQACASIPRRRSPTACCGTACHGGAAARLDPLHRHGRVAIPAGVRYDRASSRRPPFTRSPPEPRPRAAARMDASVRTWTSTGSAPRVTHVVPLTGDASDRRYFRVLDRDAESMVLALHAGPIDIATCRSCRWRD